MKGFGTGFAWICFYFYLLDPGPSCLFPSWIRVRVVCSPPGYGSVSVYLDPDKDKKNTISTFLYDELITKCFCDVIQLIINDSSRFHYGPDPDWDVCWIQIPDPSWKFKQNPGPQKAESRSRKSICGSETLSFIFF